jgi:predicted RNA-binding protein with TRAM domain
MLEKGEKDGNEIESPGSAGAGSEEAERKPVVFFSGLNSNQKQAIHIQKRRT